MHVTIITELRFPALTDWTAPPRTCKQLAFLTVREHGSQQQNLVMLELGNLLPLWLPLRFLGAAKAQTPACLTSGSMLLHAVHWPPSTASLGADCCYVPPAATFPRMTWGHHADV